MNELQIFQSEQFGSVRVKEINDEPWFVASDVCKALEIGNVSMAVGRLDNDEKGVSLIDTLGGKQCVCIVNESGLYVLALSSRKEEAKAFKRWITHDVIPSIRIHGMYAKDELLDNPDLLIAVATELKQEREARKALEAQNAALLPKGDYYDQMADRDGLTNFRDTAKLLNIREREFIAALIDDGFIYRTKRDEIRPVADRNNGYFKVKEFPLTPDRAGLQTMITFKGREHFLKRYGRSA